MLELIKAVRTHAFANYNDDGWDVLVECWDDEDIEVAIGNAKTPKRAIANCKRTVKAIDGYRAEFSNSREW